LLTRANRLTSGQAYADAIRRGRRAGTRTVVLHLADQAGSARAEEAQVGFVVSKAVGNAVTRNQVKRRLRHLARVRLESLPGSAVLVVRALPPAASASSAQLAFDLDSALSRVLTRRTPAGAPA
jgi:ribonuclease P protein component